VEIGTESTVAGGFQKGDTVVCTATPNDGEDAGTPLSSSTSIGNTAPEVTAVRVTPDPLFSGDTARCTIDGLVDVDDDLIETTTEWLVGSGTWNVGGDTIEGTFAVGDAVQCRVTPSDGEADGDTVTSAAVTTSNAAPEILSVLVTPETPLTNDIVSVSVTTSDREGDDVHLRYAWTVNGIAVGDDTNSLDGSVYFDKSDNIVITVVPSDATGEGSAYVAPGLTVGNTPPGAPSLILTPEDSVAGADDIVCEVDVASVDADDDTVSYRVDWSLYDIAYTGEIFTTEHDGDTLPASASTVGETWTCTMTPSDGVDEGTPGEAEVSFLERSYSEDFSGCADSDCGGQWPSTNPSHGYVVAGEHLYSLYDDGATSVQHDLVTDLGAPISADQWVFQFNVKHTLASSGYCSAHQVFILRSEDGLDRVGVGFQDYRAFQQYWTFQVSENDVGLGTVIYDWMTEVPPSEWTTVTITRDGNTITLNTDGRTRTATVSADFGLDLQILELYTTYSSNCDPPTTVLIDNIEIREGTTSL
jgi:hypothetical protein